MRLKRNGPLVSEVMINASERPLFSITQIVGRYKAYRNLGGIEQCLILLSTTTSAMAAWNKLKILTT